MGNINYDEISKLDFEQIILLLAKNKLHFYLSAPVDCDADIKDYNDELGSFDDIEKHRQDSSFCFRIENPKKCNYCGYEDCHGVEGYGKTPKEAVLDSIKKYNDKILGDSIAKEKRWLGDHLYGSRD